MSAVPPCGSAPRGRGLSARAGFGRSSRSFVRRVATRRSSRHGACCWRARARRRVWARRSARGAQLVALRPLATLLRCALRVNACAADRAAAARAAEEAEEERLGRHAQRRAELDALAAENAAARRAALLAAARRVCTRCGEEFFEDESNTAFSCCWHPGPRVVLATWGAAYECCRRNGRGCATAKHTAPDPVLPGDPWQPPLPAQPRRVFGATLQPPAPPDEPTYSVPAGAKYPEAGSFRYPAGLR